MTINKSKKFGFALLLLSAMFLLGSSPAMAFTQLSRNLSFGSTGTDVTNLQTFLASSSSIYPQGLVTGYYGSLTKQAVMNFQAAYGISQVGAVGPITMAKINSLIQSGVALTGGTASGADVNAPIIYSPSVSATSMGATVMWSTSEPATAEVYYSSTPFMLTEAQGNGEPTITGGTNTGETTSLQTTTNVSLSNLQPNTTYYYIIESTDASGNLQFTWPATFRTNS